MLRDLVSCEWDNEPQGMDLDLPPDILLIPRSANGGFDFGKEVPTSPSNTSSESMSALDSPRTRDPRTDLSSGSKS